MKAKKTQKDRARKNDLHQKGPKEASPPKRKGQYTPPRKDRSLKNRKLVYTLLGVIMVITIVFRLWGIKFDLPYIYYIDSTKIVKRAKLIGNNLIHKKWDIDPQFYQYPTLTTNLLALEYVVYALGYGMVATRSGQYKTMLEAMEPLFQESREYLYDPHPPIFYLLARVNNAIAGIITVLLCFFLAKLAFNNDDRIGLLAAFFLAVMFLHAKHSQYPMADSILAFWTVLAMIYVIQLLFRVKLKDHLLAGLFIGLGTSTKYLTLMLAACYGLNIVVQWWRNRHNKLIARQVIIFALIGLMMIPVGFLIGTPMFITRHQEFRNKVKSERQGMGNAESGGKFGNTQRGFWDYFYNTVPSWFEPYTMNSLWGAMGIPLLILVSCAFIYFLYCAFQGIILDAFNYEEDINQEGIDKVIYWDFILFIAIFYWFFAGKGKNRIIRYFVLAAPFLTVIGSKFLVDMMDMIPYAWVKARKGILMGGLAILIALPTTIRTIHYNQLVTHTNNRVIAGQWIEKNIPQGSSLWMPILYPPSVSAFKFRINYYRGQQKKADLYTYDSLMRVSPDIQRTLSMLSFETVIPYDYLKRAGFQYVILSSYDYGPCFSQEAMQDYPDGTRAFRKLYQDLEDKARWKKVFEDNLKDTPGPTIRIYKIN